MTTIVLNEETSRTALADVLSATTDRVVEFRDDKGNLVARLERATSKSDSGEAEGENGDALRREFAGLAEDWKTATAHVSSVSEIAMHPSYQRIIGMGMRAVPLILAELQREPRQWFWALKAITGEDPVPPEDRGFVERMAEDWLEWGRHRGMN